MLSSVGSHIFSVTSTVALAAWVAGCSSTGAPDAGVGGSGAASAPSAPGGNGNAGSSGGESAASAGTGGASAGTLLHGAFSVELNSVGPLTTIGGNLYDGEQPETEVWTTRMTAGSCALRVPSRPFCDPPCGSDACVEGNRCVAYPKPVSVGNVTVRGIGASEFSMAPKGDTFYYVSPPGVTLPYPPAQDGAPIRLEAEGGSFGPFVLEGEGISPLAITSKSPVSIATGSPLELTWTPGASTRARVSVKIDLSHHGGTKGQVVCETADTGSLSVAAELVTELIGLGLSGYPSLDVTRRATVTGSGVASAVELTVRSVERLDVSVPGLVSCSASEDCPSGQTCQADLQCK